MSVMGARRRARSPPWHHCPPKRGRFPPIFLLRALRRLGLNPCAAVHGAYHPVDNCTHRHLALCDELQVVMLPGAPRRHRALILFEFHLCEPNFTQETANGRAAEKLYFQSHVINIILVSTFSASTVYWPMGRKSRMELILKESTFPRLRHVQWKLWS